MIKTPADLLLACVLYAVKKSPESLRGGSGKIRCGWLPYRNAGLGGSSGQPTGQLHKKVVFVLDEYEFRHIDQNRDKPISQTAPLQLIQNRCFTRASLSVQHETAFLEPDPGDMSAMN